MVALEEIIKELNERSYEGEYHEVTKNGIIKEGIAIWDREFGKNPTVKPVFYWQEEWEDMSAEEIAVKLIEHYESDERVQNTAMFKDVTSAEWIKDNVFWCVQQPSREDIVKVPYLDLELYMRCSVDGGSYKIKPNMLEHYPDIMAWATENTKKNIYIEGMMSRLGFGTDEEEKMYIASNKEAYFGAGALFCTQMFHDFCVKHDIDSCYIVPSSVHELLILDESMTTAAELNEMIEDINTDAKCIDPVDVLSNHAYRYSLEDDIITSI